MKNQLKKLEEKMKEQEEQIKMINKQIQRQKWMNVYLLWKQVIGKWNGHQRIINNSTNSESEHQFQ